MQKCNAPITDGAYSSDGSIYAYAVCYDWSRGHAEHNPATSKSHILLHATNDNEVPPPPPPPPGGIPRPSLFLYLLRYLAYFAHTTFQNPANPSQTI